MMKLKKFKSIKGDKSIKIIIYSYGLMPSLCYNAKLLKKIVELDINLEHDIYCLPDK